MGRFYNPVTYYTGADSARQLAAALTDAFKQVSRVLLLTRGSDVEKSDCLQPLMDALQVKTVLRRELRLANPNLDDLYNLKRELDDFDFQLIIAVGGGSVMDIAKSLSALKRFSFETTEEMRTAVIDESYRLPDSQAFTPWIGIPTTSGTGSEVTSWATVWDKDKVKKYSISDERLYATGALIVPELTVTMPLRLSAITALDALCHAVEAYWSIRTNPITRIYALQAIKRIRTFLPRLKDDPPNPDIRFQLALASLYAGLAFSNTGTTACHSISYPLTLKHGVEHGIAASMTLGKVLKLNAPFLVEPQNLLAAFGAERMDDIEKIIFQIYGMYGLHTNLREYKVTKASIPELADRAYTKGRMDNNPAEITEAQVKEMLTELL